MSTEAGVTVRLGGVEQVPPGEGRVFEVGGTPVAVFRTRAGGVYATQPACPHRGGPLADGLLGGTTLVCPLHQRRFDLASGQPLDPGTGCLTTYPVRVSDEGELLLMLDPRPEPDPGGPGHGDPG